jgi:hypothetical protein
VRKAARLGESRELGNLRRRAPSVQNHPDLHRLKIRFRPVPPAQPFSADRPYGLLYNDLRS